VGGIQAPIESPEHRDKKIGKGTSSLVPIKAEKKGGFSRWGRTALNAKIKRINSKQRT